MAAFISWGRDRPWRSALRLEVDFPAAVCGPVERCAFRRFAASCLAVAMRFVFTYLGLLVSVDGLADVSGSLSYLEAPALWRNSFISARRPASLCSFIRCNFCKCGKYL